MEPKLTELQQEQIQLTPDDWSAIAEAREQIILQLQDKLDHAEKCCAEMREALRKIADISQLTNVTFEVQAFTAVDIALTALKDGLRKYGRHDDQCAARLGRNITCTCGLNAALREGK